MTSNPAQNPEPSPQAAMPEQRLPIVMTSALLIALLAVGYWGYDRWLSSPAPDQQTTRSVAPAQAPESIVYDFQQTTFTQAGGKEFAVNAQQVLYFSKTAIADLVQPSIYFFSATTSNQDATSNTGVDWVAKANSGHMNETADNLLLEGNVAVSKPLAQGKQLRFTTDHLKIYPRREIAETDATVTITQALHTTKSSGMVINIADGKIQLLSKVKSRYVPPR